MNTAIIARHAQGHTDTSPTPETVRIPHEYPVRRVSDELALAVTDRLPRIREEEVRIDLESDDCFFQGFEPDPALGGIFVATDASVAAGTRVAVDVSVPGLATRFRALGVVEFESPGGELPAGVGVRFVSLNDEARRCIARFATLREPLFYDAD